MNQKGCLDCYSGGGGKDETVKSKVVQLCRYFWHLKVRRHEPAAQQEHLEHAENDYRKRESFPENYPDAH